MMSEMEAMKKLSLNMENYLLMIILMVVFGLIAMILCGFGWKKIKNLKNELKIAKSNNQEDW